MSLCGLLIGSSDIERVCMHVRVCVPYTFRSVYVLHTTEKEREREDEEKRRKEEKSELFSLRCKQVAINIIC